MIYGRTRGGALRVDAAQDAPRVEAFEVCASRWCGTCRNVGTLHCVYASHAWFCRVLSMSSERGICRA